MVFALEDASLARAQCKWAPMQKGVVSVRAYSCRRTAEGFRRSVYNPGEIDGIAAYRPDNGRCYYLPASMALGASASSSASQRRETTRGTG
jgi:PD-(D/E)XK endonuclease